MTLNYLKDQISDELNGARGYIEKAIEAKISKPMWSRIFVSMADAEAEHAANLMNIMESFIREMKKNETRADSSLTVSNGSPEDIYKNCMKEFGETMTYVNNMKRGL